ncbi:hypothetical protein BN1232_05760 [Mycobacterium lentiflavum]|uniref:Uncharacterized protein n=1 Tax=Mycobacterium lentiflavum TaxID=141349 RepID=A0A0E4H574_MYCLN|nr:hypothetical protein [Mycobacterium lentiflavum]CQD22851.1 hypothetical protein BN1232_05760 [Mycobacterium lentiflavum]
MTTTQQHIEDLDEEGWAALTRRASADAVAAAERHGVQAPAALLALATMTETQLIERRKQSGPPRKRLSPMMRLVEADHLRHLAEAHARDAQQDKLDAEAAASAARAEAEQSARTATSARQQARAVQEQSAQKEAERAAERTEHHQAVQQLRGEIGQIRADTSAEIGRIRAEAEGEIARIRTDATAGVEQTRADANTQIAAVREQLAAAEARAEQRAAERAAERAAHEQALQRVRNELAQVRADAAAEVAAAREQVIAAEARAAQRSEERIAERARAEEEMQRLRGEIEQAHADAAAEIAGARGWASGEIAAAREAAQAEIARAHAAAEDAIRQAQAAQARSAPQHLLSIPMPPLQIRHQTLHIEHALNALQQIDQVLEVGMSADVGSNIPLDITLMYNLVQIVQEHAVYLSNEPDIRSDTSDDPAASYAQAAAAAFRMLLDRIDVVAGGLRSRDQSPEVDIVNAVSAMLADPWVVHVRSVGSESFGDFR